MSEVYINQHALLTIFLMGLVTYFTRISGYLLFKNRNYPRLTMLFEIIPGAVMVSLIAPAFASGRIADLIALALTVLVAIRYSFLMTLVVGIVSAAVLRYLIG